MKKKLFLMACLAVVGILRVKAQQSIIALHHEGNVTIYAGAKTQEAMDASVKGDTLYLSEGTFSGFNVTHGIVVLGSGEKTVVSGNITITGNEEKKDLEGYVFSGLHLLNNFFVHDSVKGLRMSQCNMNLFYVNNIMESGEIVMCRIRQDLAFHNANCSLEVFNSIILNVYYGGKTKGAITFNHCNIGWAQHDGGMGNNANDRYDANNTYINCMLHRVDYATCLNCLYDEEVNATLNNCYRLDYDADSNFSAPLSDEELKAAGYLGNDGTVVGITGGEIPYTLELAGPHVVDHKVEVDNVNRKMTVTLKMAHEATKEEK